MMSPSKSSRSICARSISYTESECPQRKISKPRIRKSVQISPSVTLRCFFHINGPQTINADANSSSSRLWLKRGDVDEIKSNAKTLAKLHHQIRTNNNITTNKALSSSTVISGHAARYQIKGESLRGMEYITDITTGNKRRRVREEAMTATVKEQQVQLIQHVLDSNTVDQAVSNAMKLDTGKLARIYGSKAKEALVYAQHMAREDAEIASEILTDDLPSVTSINQASNMNDACNSLVVKSLKMKTKTNNRPGIANMSSTTDPEVAADNNQVDFTCYNVGKICT